MSPESHPGEFSFPGVPLDRPSAARIYDYMLGGYHNFEIDRQIAERFMAVYPDFARTAQVNRAYLRRALEFVTGQGIDQFLDLGSGIPTAGNVHEIVAHPFPDARVVYVDIDPIAVAHSETILRGNPNVAAIRGDIADAEAILSQPNVVELLDFSRPLGLIMLAVVHFVPDLERAVRAVDAFKAALAPGSYLIFGTWTYDDAPEDALTQYAEMIKATPTPARPHSRAMVERYFSGLEIVEPGIVHSPAWRPEGADDLMVGEPGRSLTWVGVARKP